MVTVTLPDLCSKFGNSRKSIFCFFCGEHRTARTEFIGAIRVSVAGDAWTTHQCIALIDLVKLVKVAAVDPSDLSQAGGRWAAVQIAWEDGRIMKVFPKRSAGALKTHWYSLKEEIATVNPFPSVSGSGSTSGQHRTALHS